MDNYVMGDWNATCFECGRKAKASLLKRHWKGYWVCPECYETRHPQDFVRAATDKITPPFVQPQWEHDIEIHICSVNGRSAIPGYPEPGCMIPGNTLLIES